MNGVVRAARRRICYALVIAGACVSGCHAKSDAASAGGESPLPPVDAPASLLVEGVVATPDATLQRVQRGIGGGAGLFPSTLGGIVCAATGLDARLGAEINGASPAYLVLAGDPAAPSWVLAARLVEARRARPLYEGTTAVLDAHDGGAGLVLLAERQDTRALPPGRHEVVGIAPGGWVVIGQSAAALADLAPYATRTLPLRPPARESITFDVPPSALAGSLATAAARGWSDAERAMLEDDRALRAAHDGRAPDFGDPRAIVSALDGWTQRKIAALRDLRGAHVAIDVTDDDVSAVVTASPASQGGAASAMVAALRTGDSAPLARVPRGTELAILTRDDAAGRAGEAADLEGALVATLGPRLAAADARRVHAAFEDWTGARGDWATLALALLPAGLGVVADVPSSDPARTSRAVHEAVDVVAHVPAIHDPLATWLHASEVAFSAAEVPGGGHASMATLAKDGASRTSPASVAALAWVPGEADVKIALGATPLPFLAPPLPGETLGDDPAMRALLGSVGDVAGAIVAQPGRSPGCVATGGVVFGWGARPDAAGVQALRATLAASDTSLRCLARSFF